MDTHSPALFGKKWGWTLPMQRYISRFAELNVIDQERWRKLFESWGSKAIVLENPPKEIAVETLTDLSEPGRPEFVYVGTFNLDEPVDIVLEAAKQFPHCHFYLLGRKNQVKPAWWEMAPANVTFTGYLLQDEYWSRIHSARALIALTTYEYSLVGAGMDGLYANKPVIVSDTETLREFFTEGAVLVPNTAEGLAAGIQQLLDNEEQYKQGIHRLREATETRWKQNFETLRQTIYRKAKPETPPDSQLKAAGSPQ
jgi:glycosyltransferase involved in cell wall biosynthesis